MFMVDYFVRDAETNEKSIELAIKLGTTPEQLWSLRKDLTDKFVDKNVQIRSSIARLLFNNPPEGLFEIMLNYDEQLKNILRGQQYFDIAIRAECNVCKTSNYIGAFEVCPICLYEFNRSDLKKELLQYE